jgi:hypothetical protein
MYIGIWQIRPLPNLTDGRNQTEYLLECCHIIHHHMRNTQYLFYWRNYCAEYLNGANYQLSKGLMGLPFGPSYYFSPFMEGQLRAKCKISPNLFFEFVGDGSKKCGEACCPCCWIFLFSPQGCDPSCCPSSRVPRSISKWLSPRSRVVVSR